MTVPTSPFSVAGGYLGRIASEFSVRTVFVLRDIEGLSDKDTADAVGISVLAVKSRLLWGASAIVREGGAFFPPEKGMNVFAYL